MVFLIKSKQEANNRNVNKNPKKKNKFFIPNESFN